MKTLTNQHPDQRIPILSWAEQMESGALRQAINLSMLPVARQHIAIMPDVHIGYGMPIGGVLATEDVVVPNAVGVDIGCGMRVVKTGLNLRDIRPKLGTILSQILSTIPTGFKHHQQQQYSDLFKHGPAVPIIQQELESAKRQLGSLGGGNHFIELQTDEENAVWIMIHSGSRNFGYKTAKTYHNKAQQWCRQNRISLPDRDLAYLPADNEWGQEYLAAMDYAQKFARENRRHMMQAVMRIVDQNLPQFAGRYAQELDVHHNYAVWEEHFGQQLLVHRKGAVNAARGRDVIVPGSMATPSYICRGLGNTDSFRSSAHGAGRRMGRKQAVRTIPAEQVFHEMEQAGIVVRKHNRQDMAEEAKQAYKDIDTVMQQQEDLVSIETKLMPIGVVMG